MASATQSLTTYYAKRIIGDTAAADETSALLQTGADVATDTWILHRTNRNNLYGIKYLYDNSTGGQADKIELYGGNTSTAWVELDTGDVYIMGKVGIGYNPNTTNNNYSLYVNGTSYFNNDMYIKEKVGIGYDPNTTGNTCKLYVNGTLLATSYITSGIEGSNGSTSQTGLVAATTGGRIVLFMNPDDTNSERTCGLWVSAHGTGTNKNILLVDTNNNVSLNGNAATATKATQDGSGNIITDKYFQIYNTGYLGSSSTVTVNDLATQGPAYGMINAATDNPNGNATWTHVLNMAWGKTNTSWIGQIALSTSGSWIKFRGTSGAISGVAWKTCCDLESAQNFTGNKSWGTSGAGGILYGNATNGGINSIRIGDDVYLGDCNAGGIMGMKSTGSNCGFYFYNSGGTQIGQFYTNGTNFTCNKPIARAGVARSWINGRDTAIIRTTSYSGYDAILSMKTTNGAWELGVYTSNICYFVYTPDTQYNAGTNSSYNNSVNIRPEGKIYAAVWNDYAEYRKDNKNEQDKQQPGRCVSELGDGSLALSTTRLQRGCEIISDTFGFAIGENQEEGYNTPVAISGRVLAYPYESIEEFKNHIGHAVCSGPNGTVSIMTPEEEKEHPACIIGTISEIPVYTVWGTGKVKVNNRVWIRIR